MEISVESTADAYLELLARRGIKYFFANAGTDFAPLLEGFAKRGAEGKPWPKPVLCPHESTAVSMAHGYYMVTREPQAAMVHVTVGTANAAAQVMNASRSQVPILFTAGRTPITEEGLFGGRNVYIHWAQESRDQGAMIREYVKWDYELRHYAQLETVVDRALSLAMADPPGPVYLILPREILAEKHTALSLRRAEVRYGGSSPQPNAEQVERAAELLAGAESPLLIAGASGLDPDTVPLLVDLAETGAIPVVEFRSLYTNFPSSHPLHLGFDPQGLLQEADTVVVLETDVPWMPVECKPPVSAPVIHLGRDPYYSSYVIRGYPMDVALVGEPAAGLRNLRAALAERVKGKEAALKKRRARLGGVHDRQRAEWARQAKAAGREKPIDPRWVSSCINQINDEDTLLVNEYDLVSNHVDFTRPGAFFGSPHASGLGWALGASLGAKLARPEKTVIATVGDGSYMFNSPTSAHFVSRAQGLPILVVVFNNQCWNAVRKEILELYPDGWSTGRDQYALCDLEPSPHFEKSVEAHEGYGERVEDPREVLPALKRALRAVREEGRQALLNVICKHP
ncbi:MAG: thiamine pyrophosphate-requiring protein [Candidatus Tectomicrobia bacterium]|nr:thiamine pyrophosphate-requiring protein [Candidatus Tectomicrobia bacterium]